MRCALALLAMPFLVIVIFIALIYPTDRIIAKWIDPELSGNGSGRYELAVVERDIDLFNLGFDRRFELLVQRQGGSSSHVVPVELFGDAKSKECKSSCEVRWSKLGVEFSQSSGYRIFIPASAYSGGR